MKNFYDSLVKNKLESFSERLYELIAKRKEETGKTNAIQADDMGITPSNLSKYIPSIDNDKNKAEPRASSLIRISEYYSVSLDYLFGSSEYQSPVSIDTTSLDENTRKRIVCDYMGMSEETVEMFRNLYHDRINRLIFDSLLKDSDSLNAFLDYYTSSLLDIFVSSDYSQLRTNPLVSKKLASTAEQEKICYANLLDKLPFSRKNLSNRVKNDSKLKLEVAFSLAQKLVDLRAALAEARDSYEQDGRSETFYNKINLIKELDSDNVPHGQDRFTILNSLLVSMREQNDIIDSIARRRTDSDETDYYCENDPDEDSYIRMPPPPNADNEGVRLSASTFCGIPTWKIESDKDKTDSH